MKTFHTSCEKVTLRIREAMGSSPGPGIGYTD